MLLKSFGYSTKLFDPTSFSTLHLTRIVNKDHALFHAGDHTEVREKGLGFLSFGMCL
jgi:hypothetical protein